MKINFAALLERARSFDPQATPRPKSGVRTFEYTGKSFKNLGGETSQAPATKIQEILTPEQLAERLKVPVSWVFEKRRPRCKNPIPAIPMGKIIRFDWHAVVEWLEKQAAADAASIEQRRNSVHARKGPRLVKGKAKTKAAA